MRTFAALIAAVALVSAATAANINPYGNQQSEPQSAGYGQSEPQSSGYGQTQTQERCRTVTENVPQEHCEPYSNRVCTTTQRENCRQVAGRNCRAVVASQTHRKCFNVTETRCSLKEEVKFETVPVPIVVQKCNKVNERVCGTVHETDVNMKDEVQCINVEKENCQPQDQVVNDRTCRTTVNFDCSVQQTQSAPSMAEMMQPRQSGYNRVARGTEYAASQAQQESSSYGSSRNAYGQPQVNCRRTPETKCYDTPRTVSVQRCGKTIEEQCETLSVSQPFVTPKQACHNEEKRVCRLEHSNTEKKVKKFEYTKQCRQVPRRVCENEERKQLVPSCVPSSHAECNYTPVEQCEDMARQHCFQFTVPRSKTVCEQVQTQSGYPESDPSPASAYGAPATSSAPVDDY